MTWNCTNRASPALFEERENVYSKDTRSRIVRVITQISGEQYPTKALSSSNFAGSRGQSIFNVNWVISLRKNRVTLGGGASGFRGVVPEPRWKNGEVIWSEAARQWGVLMAFSFVFRESSAPFRSFS